jgi:hypothetical protein
MTTINTFRPQPVMIHAVFVVVLSYVFGRMMHQFLPSKGLIGRILNPGPVRQVINIIRQEPNLCLV